MRGEAVTVEPTSDWPYVYIDDAADAVIAACFSNNRRQLHYFIAFPEQVTLKQLAELASRDGGGTALLHVDTSRPKISRGPLDIAPARRDFGFAPKIDYRTGIRRLIDALAQH
jgi:nucleoside-diphosphate-sugar epimerase